MHVIVDIPADALSLLNYQNVTPCIGELTCQHRSSQSGTNNDVISRCHNDFPLVR